MISSETSRVRYAGDGVTTDFVAPWHQVDLSLKVVKRAVTGVETELPFGSGYTYASTSDTGATIRCGVAPAVGEVLAILRNDPATQTTDLVDNEAFPAAAIENSIDRAIAVGAMLKERWTRALALKDTDGLAGGEYPAGGNRISGLADPINDTDAATKGWVSILLAQYAAGAGAVITPGSATSPNWNANALYGRAVANRGADRRLRAHMELHEQPLGAEGFLERDGAPRDAQRVDLHQHLRRRGDVQGHGHPLHGGQGARIRVDLAAHQGPLLRHAVLESHHLHARRGEPELPDRVPAHARGRRGRLGHLRQHRPRQCPGAAPRLQQHEHHPPGDAHGRGRDPRSSRSTWMRRSPIASARTGACR
jgi:hypothetical protein